MEEFVHITTKGLLTFGRDIDLGQCLTCLFEIVVNLVLAELTDANLIVEACNLSHLYFTIERLGINPLGEFGTLLVISTVVGVDKHVVFLLQVISPPMALPNTLGSP